MTKIVTPSNALLALAALFAFAGATTIVAPQQYMDLISVNAAPMSSRELLCFQLAGYASFAYVSHSDSICAFAFAAALVGLHKNPSTYGLRAVGVGMLIHCSFELYILYFFRSVFKLSAILSWLIPYLAFAGYFLVAKVHHTTHHASVSPRRSRKSM